MKQRLRGGFLPCLLGAGLMFGIHPAANAGVITLEQAIFRVQGDFTFVIDVSAWDATPAGLTFAPPAGADFSEYTGNTGLGIITATITPNFGSGSQSGSFAAFFDLEIDEATNTFFNENASATGATGGANPTAFEIDEPGFVFGDIFDNFLDDNLDGTNAVPAGSEDDVSIAIDWDFTLSHFETAALTLVISDLGFIAPGSGFRIDHLDPDSVSTVTYSGALSLSGDQPPPPPPPPEGVVPEPASLLLLGVGMAGALASRRTRKRS